MIIDVEFEDEIELEKACLDAWLFAIRNYVTVRFVFNGVELLSNAETNPENLKKEYSRKRELK